MKIGTCNMIANEKKLPTRDQITHMLTTVNVSPIKQKRAWKLI